MHVHRITRVVWWLLGLLLPVPLLAQNVAVPTHSVQLPNVIRIMADDLGYGDLESYGQRLMRTPNLSRMAAEGLRFTQYYAGSAACNPSRFAYMTGRHAGTTGVTTNDSNALPVGAMNVARLMQKAGYTTGIIGKWALGEPGTGSEPLQVGFDYFYGYPTQAAAHNYYPQHLMENRASVALKGNLESQHLLVLPQRQTYAPAVIQQRALAFIKANSGHRFYLQLDINLPHANSELLKSGGNGFEHPGAGRYASEEGWTEHERSYAEMVSLMDDFVGTILETLRELGIEQNTLVIFTADNGPAGERGAASLERFAASGPLKGIKGELTEGGIRVPMIAWWPGTIAAGQTSNAVIAAWDELPTLAELVNSQTSYYSDGVSFAGVLRGTADVPKKRLLYWRLKNQMAARYGDWKLLCLQHNTDSEQIFLYNLASDPAEKNDLSASEPRELHQLLLMTAMLARQ